MQGLSLEDRIRVRMFHLLYKEMADEPNNTVRFVKAIATTCDERLDLTDKEDMIKEWAETHCQVGRPKK